MQPHVAGARRQPGPHVAIDHRLHLAGRPGSSAITASPCSIHSPGAVPCGFASTVAPRGTCACRRLFAGIFQPRAAKRFSIAVDDRRILLERQVEMRRHHFPREVVVGGTEAAGQDQHAMPRQCVRDVRGQLVAVVADDRLERHRDPEVVEDLRDVERVGVGLLRRQQLAADGDDRRGERHGLSAVSQAGTIHTAQRSTRCAYTPGHRVVGHDAEAAGQMLEASRRDTA